MRHFLENCIFRSEWENNRLNIFALFSNIYVLPRMIQNTIIKCFWWIIVKYVSYASEMSCREMFLYNSLMPRDSSLWEKSIQKLIIENYKFTEITLLSNVARQVLRITPRKHCKQYNFINVKCCKYKQSHKENIGLMLKKHVWGRRNRSPLIMGMVSTLAFLY